MTEKLETCRKAIEKYGIKAQVGMMHEEMCELGVALEHWKRDRCKKEDVVTEIADVMIVAAQMAIYFGKEEVDAEIDRKLEGLEGRMKGESEDETIRKKMIEHFKSKKKETWCNMPIKSILAYLEKQKDICGERAKNITANMLEDGIEGIQRELIEFLSNTVNASWVDIIQSADAYAERIRNIIEKQKEQKPSPLFKVGDRIKLKSEPKYPFREIIDIKDGAYYFDAAVHLPFKEQDKWEAEQKTTEWSEEDEATAYLILKELEHDKKDSPEYSRHFARLIDWFTLRFKSLCPQPKHEQPEVDFEQELYRHFGQVKDFTLGMRIGKYFYELGLKAKEENK